MLIIMIFLRILVIFVSVLLSLFRLRWVVWFLILIFLSFLFFSSIRMKLISFFMSIILFLGVLSLDMVFWLLWCMFFFVEYDVWILF